MIDEEPAHDARRHGEEVRAVAELGLSQCGQPEVRLVDERGRVERQVTSLVAPATTRQPSKLLVHDGHERLEGGDVAVVPTLQQNCKVG